jgi:hypothetical protein
MDHTVNIKSVKPECSQSCCFSNSFQQQTFLCSRAHVLAGWQPSHNNLLLFELLPQDCLMMAAGLCYIASAWTAQKTPLPTVLLLSGDVAVHADRAGNTVPIVCASFVMLMSCLLCHSLVMALSSVLMLQYIALL